MYMYDKAEIDSIERRIISEERRTNLLCDTVLRETRRKKTPDMQYLSLWEQYLTSERIKTRDIAFQATEKVYDLEYHSPLRNTSRHTPQKIMAVAGAITGLGTVHATTYLNDPTWASLLAGVTVCAVINIAFMYRQNKRMDNLRNKLVFEKNDKEWLQAVDTVKTDTGLKEQVLEYIKEA